MQKKWILFVVPFVFSGFGFSYGAFAEERCPSSPKLKMDTEGMKDPWLDQLFSLRNEKGIVIPLAERPAVFSMDVRNPGSIPTGDYTPEEMKTYELLVYMQQLNDLKKSSTINKLNVDLRKLAPLPKFKYCIKFSPVYVLDCKGGLGKCHETKKLKNGRTYTLPVDGRLALACTQIENGKEIRKILPYEVPAQLDVSKKDRFTTSMNPFTEKAVQQLLKVAIKSSCDEYLAAMKAPKYQKKSLRLEHHSDQFRD